MSRREMLRKRQEAQNVPDQSLFVMNQSEGNNNNNNNKTYAPGRSARQLQSERQEANKHFSQPLAQTLDTCKMNPRWAKRVCAIS